MSGPASDFSRLMQRVVEGDQNAIDHLYSLYNPSLLNRLSIRLDKIRRLRSLLDPEDLAQDVWLRFFTVSVHRKQFATPDHLMRYLARMAGNLSLKAARDHLDTQKRDARRRHYLSEASSGAAALLADPAPSPTGIAEVRDECETRLSSLTNEHQQLAQMIGAGYNHEEIAGKLGCSERTIERKMSDIRQSFVA